MKKVLFIITKSVWGGAQKYVHDIAVNLPEDKFQAALAGGGSGPMAEKIKAAGFPYFEIKNFQRDVNIFKEFFSFFEIIKILFKEKPDIVHVSSSKAGGVAGLAFFVYSALRRVSLFFHRGGRGDDFKTRLHLPVHSPSSKSGVDDVHPHRHRTSMRPLAVFTVHGWAFLEDRPNWQIWLIKLTSKLTCLFYDKIVCVSKNDYTEALKNKIAPEKKLTVIHNGVKPEDYSFEEKTEKEFVVGTIGESTKNKGHKYLTEAAKIIAGIKLNIINNIPGAAKYLKNFDIFVLPSVKEGLPYVILEAGLAGLPVVASNVGGIPEIIDDGKSGLLVPPANPEALANAIKKLIKDKALRETLAKNLHEKIIKEFSLGQMLSATMAAYEN